jgi:hypothetical protein
MSNPSSTAEFLDLVRQSGIVPEKQLTEFLGGLDDPPQDPVRLAAVLVKRGVVTNFQAKLLLAGKYRGFRIGQYVIRDQLGQGGMGAVYLAEHETLRRRVALKVLSKADAAGPAGVERFMREARSAAALDHPNIVRLFDVGRQGSLHYLVMEYVDGQTLEQVLTRGPIPCGRAAEYIAQAAAGLQHAYEKGFVHRDIKPANLMLARNGTIKILDMGLARSYDGGDRLTELLDQGVILGTADFISPEQAINSPDVDTRSDVYSLGATFYALVTGRPPFEGNTTQKLLQHQMREAPLLNELDPTFPDGLADVVAVMMAKRPEDRFQTPAEVIAALAPWVPNSAQVVAGLSGTDLGKTGISTADGTDVTLGRLMANRTRRMTGRLPDAPPRRQLTTLIGGGVAVLGLILAILVLALPGGQKQQQTPPPDQSQAAAQPTPRPADTSKAKSQTKSQPKGGQKAPPSADSPGHVVFRLDAASVPAFRNRKEGSQLVSGDRDVMPAGTYIHGWKHETLAEFAREDVDGVPALALTHLNATTSAQIGVELERPGGGGAAKLAADREYVVRVTYRTSGAASGRSYVQTHGDYAQVESAELPTTGGSWRTVEYKFTKPDRAVRLLIDTYGTGEGNTLYIREVVVAEPGGLAEPAVGLTATAGQPAFRLDLSGLTPFRATVSDRVPNGSLLQPPGVMMHCWKKESVAEFRGSPEPDGFALAVTNLNDDLSAQILFLLADTPIGRDREYVARLEYRTANDAHGELSIRGANYAGFARVELAPTDGRWRTAEVRFRRPAAPELDAAIENKAVGEGNTLYVRKFEVYPVK